MMTAFFSATTLAILAGFGANLKDGSQAFLRFAWLRDIMFVRKTSRLWDRGTTGYEPPPV